MAPLTVKATTETGRLGKRDCVVGWHLPRHGGDATVADKSPSTGPVFATGRPDRGTAANRGRTDRPLS
jgi:hypothetical protein